MRAFNSSHRSVTRSALRAASILGLLLGFGVSFAAANPDESRYECVVNSNHAACESTAPAATAENTAPAPNSYAQYLMLNGMGKDRAIAYARGIGEEPLSRSNHIEVSSAGLSSLEIYSKLMGTHLDTINDRIVERHAAAN